MRILLTGANGQVGWELVQRAAGRELITFDRDGLDITDAQAVGHAFAASRPQLLINAAAYTAVDRAEQEPEQAFAVNRDGAAQLAAACAELGIPLLHISTDYVFDGTKHEPYQENDPPAPLGVYGGSKWAGEEAVRKALPTHLIIRVSWVFGRHGHNFVKTIRRLARERNELKVVADQRGCPTYAGDIADVLLLLADRIAAGQNMAWGTYHYCGAPPTTWYHFAKTIVELAGNREPLTVQAVSAITTAEYPAAAPRPMNSVLDCQLIKNTFGIAPRPWQAGLEAMLETAGVCSLAVKSC